MPETRSADDIRTDIAQAFELYMSELEQSAPHWQRTPASGEGEEAWNARQVAEHIAGGAPFFGAAIANALSIPGPTPARVELPDGSAAPGKTRELHGLFFDVANQVTDDQLPVEIDHPRLGKFTVGSILELVNSHLRDHANQLKSLREG